MVSKSNLAVRIVGILLSTFLVDNRIEKEETENYRPFYISLLPTYPWETAGKIKIIQPDSTQNLEQFALREETREEKIERDRVLDVVNTQPKQFQLTLLAIFDVCNLAESPVFTGDIYEIYKSFCGKVGLKPLTQRRVSDIIAELDMLGIINARVISKGRYGRTREIKLGIPSSTIPNIRTTLKESLNL